MNTSTQKLFGISALALAVLFPIYWINAIGFAFDVGEMSYREDFTTLDVWDLIFLIIGLLEITVYVGLRNYFKDQINGGFAGVLLLIMAGLIALTHATLLIDLTVGLGLFSATPGFLDTIAIGSILVLGLYAVTLFALAIALLVRFPELPTLIKIFAALALITAGSQITIVFSFANIILFPILMLIVAFHFLLGDNNVEVV
ncbi:hypothetical protein CWE21_06915 [Pseudidiomarina aquimaris]|uniref:DUF4386 domain-containing protein n=1 Tax=Pseudidiomarina aquimaris TaxID=641841 RepID=A0A432XHU2_9GAMM|nr:hypothetical protein [Pseudidiomarina aquimaris]RUO48271.1 hypothetical protein CWE21_06915 [Pseudidiomarina aquimaris]